VPTISIVGSIGSSVVLVTEQASLFVPEAGIAGVMMVAAIAP